MKKGKIVKKLFVLLVAVVMVSTVISAKTIKIGNNDLKKTTTEKLDEQFIVTNDIEPLGLDFVVWDNWMGFDYGHHAHYNESAGIDCYMADDFQFDEETEVFDVHWIGCYWHSGYEQAAYDWKILFYEDRGDGAAPGDIFAGPYTYTQEQCTPDLLLDTGWSIYYEMSVNLPEYVVFPENDKFWISIWADGDAEPWSAWGLHEAPILKHHQAVLKSEYWGHPDWTDYDVFNPGYPPADMCFQLTTVVDYLRPDVKIDKPERALYFQDSKVFNRLLGLTTIIGDVTIEVTATDAETGIEKVEFYGGLFGDILLGTDTEAPYNFTWQRDRIRFCHIQKLRVVAYDLAGNTAYCNRLVRKIL